MAVKLMSGNAARAVGRVVTKVGRVAGVEWRSLVIRCPLSPLRNGWTRAAR